MKVFVLAEHPADALGFTTVATNVSRELVARGWPVTYVAMSPAVTPAPQLPYDLVSAATLSAAAKAVATMADGPSIAIMFGRGDDALSFGRDLRSLDRTGQVDFTFYTGVDYAPAPDRFYDVLEVVDRVVPATRFGAQVLGSENCESPIAHGVDTDVFAPLTEVERARARRGFGVSGELLIGYFGRNSGHKRPDLALRAFAHYARGTWVSCLRCGLCTVAEFDRSGR